MTFRKLIRPILLSSALMLAAPGALSAEKSLVCDVLEREAWMDAFLATENRWGVSVEAQLALVSEDWQLEQRGLPSRWRPAWTRFDDRTPGIPAGYFDTTWERYEAVTGNRNASPDDISDFSDFIGWYVSSAASYAHVAPDDAAAIHILWRKGPRYYASGAWITDSFVTERAQRFANHAQAISDGFHSCFEPVSTDDPGHNGGVAASASEKASGSLLPSFSPWRWRQRRGYSADWIATLDR